MPSPRSPSAAKRLRWRGRCIQTLAGPNRQQRRALAKAAVAKFKDDLILAGHDPKKMERLLAKWDGNPRTDPLEALINPKAAPEPTTLELTEEAKQAGFSMEVPDPREAELTEAGKRDWLHRFDEVKS